MYLGSKVAQWAALSPHSKKVTALTVYVESFNVFLVSTRLFYRHSNVPSEAEGIQIALTITQRTSFSVLAL